DAAPGLSSATRSAGDASSPRGRGKRVTNADSSSSGGASMVTMQSRYDPGKGPSRSVAAEVQGDTTAATCARLSYIAPGQPLAALGEAEKIDLSRRLAHAQAPTARAAKNRSSAWLDAMSATIWGK